MRPYLAILRDSFHEALSSRVLWILLILTALFLAALAPLGVYEKARSTLERVDFLDPSALLQALAGADAAAMPSTPEGRVKGLLSDDLRGRLTALPSADDRAARFELSERLRDELNGLLARRDFYDQAAWDATRLDREARDLRDQGLASLTEAQLARFNRMALEAAFPDAIAESGGERMQIYYLGWEPGTPVTEQQYSLIAQGIIVGFMEFLVGVGGVFVAILVTASIIPHTYDAGAIDLLLSKPVSRSLVFLTKFLGGCAFILIVGSFLIVGLWLILGLRLQLWNHKLLLCIPIYLFLFGIYYAVSALAGVLWRNAIVCVVITIVFWFACSSIGVAKALFDTLAINPTRIVTVVPAGEELLSVNEAGEVQRWKRDAQAWEPIFVRTQGRAVPAFAAVAPGAMAGPLYDAEKGRLLAVDSPRSQFAMFGGSAPLWLGSADNGWLREQGIDAPAGTEALLLSPQAGVVAVAAGGVFRLAGEPTQDAATMKVLGFDVAVPGEGGTFVPAGIDLRLNSPLSAALDPQSGMLAIFDGNELTLLAADAQDFRQRATVAFDPREAGIVAVGAGKVLLALKGGDVHLYDAGDLTPIETLHPYAAAAPRFVASSRDGRWFAVVYHDGNLWMYDAQQEVAVEADVTGQGNVSAAAFSPQGTLLVADRLTRVTEYNIDSWGVVAQSQPGMGILHATYRFGINPLYTVFPRPGELSNIIAQTLFDEDMDLLQAGIRANDLSAARVEIDVWGPIWSNLAFVVIVLSLGCLYVARKDF